MEFSVLSIKSFEEKPFVYGVRPSINFILEVDVELEDFKCILSNFSELSVQREVIFFIDYTIKKFVFYGSKDSLIKIRKEVEDILLFL